MIFKKNKLKTILLICNLKNLNGNKVSYYNLARNEINKIVANEKHKLNMFYVIDKITLNIDAMFTK